MEDMERYGDYNEIDEPPVKSKNIFLIVLKVLTALCCLGVVGILGFRMILFNNYPATIENIYFNDNLTEYYNATAGDIGAKTQNLRAKYDDPDKGRFFCDNLIVIAGAEQLQISLRYNASNLSDIREELKLAEPLDDANPDILSFRLVDNNGQIYNEVSVVAFKSKMMYRYYKIVADGIDFDGNGETYPEWIRLEIFVEGQTSEEPFAMVAIYENHEDYNEFTDYIIKDSDKPTGEDV